MLLALYFNSYLIIIILIILSDSSLAQKITKRKEKIFSVYLHYYKHKTLSIIRFIKPKRIANITLIIITLIYFPL